MFSVSLRLCLGVFMLFCSCRWFCCSGICFIVVWLLFVVVVLVLRLKVSMLMLLLFSGVMLKFVV